MESEHFVPNNYTKGLQNFFSFWGLRKQHLDNFIVGEERILQLKHLLGSPFPLLCVFRESWKGRIDSAVLMSRFYHAGGGRPRPRKQASVQTKHLLYK